MSTDGAAPLDGSTIDDLRDQLGDDILERVLDAYLDELPRYLDELRAGAEAGDAVVLRRAAHSLKGASRLIGGEPLAAACERLEAAARQGTLEGAPEAIAAIVVLAGAVAAAVRALVPG